MGGNDQQGNIIAGIDLIRKKTGGQAGEKTMTGDTPTLKISLMFLGKTFSTQL